MCFIRRSSRLFVSLVLVFEAGPWQWKRRGMISGMHSAQTVSLRSVTPKLFLAHQLQVLLEQFFFIIVMVFAPQQGDLFLLGSYLQSGTRTPRLLWALGPYRRCVVESRPWRLLRQSSKVSSRQVHSTSLTRKRYWHPFRAMEGWDSTQG